MDRKLDEQSLAREQWINSFRTMTFSELTTELWLIEARIRDGSGTANDISSRGIILFYLGELKNAQRELGC